MDRHQIEKLTQLGELVDLGSGRKGVRVSLQYQPRLTQRERDARRDLLRHEFASVAADLQPRGAVVDLDSLSLSAQTIEAVLPLDRIDELERELGDRDVRVDLLIDRDVV